MALARDVDQDLEEVHLREVSRPVDERHEHLLPLPLPLRDEVLHQRRADPVALRDHHPVELGGREPLLAAGPSRRLGQQLLEPRADRVEHGRRPVGPAVAGLGALDVPANRVAGDPQLARDLARRAALHQHLVANQEHLIHPEHPPAEAPDAPAGQAFRADVGGSVFERRLDQFSGGGINRGPDELHLVADLAEQGFWVFSGQDVSPLLRGVRLHTPVDWDGNTPRSPASRGPL